MRNLNDRLWGVWAPDERASLIWNISRKLLNQYNLGLDMVYEDTRFPVDGLYANIYYWNQTTLPTTAKYASGNLKDSST